MNRNIPLLLIVLLTQLFYTDARASHMMGGDIAYECISPGKYKLVLKIYRDCRGIPFNSPTIEMFCKDGTNLTSVNYTRTAINDISPKCPSDPKPCSPTNQTISGEGIEEHVFEAIVDFNTSPYKAFKDAGCCEVMIAIQQQARNNAITTGFAGQNFYTDAMINICNIEKTKNKCNTSPQISIPPVGYACCNQPFTYNNGVREVVDGDSLSYDLGVPLVGNNTNGTYNGAFNSQIPMTPFCPPNPGVINCRPLPNAKPPRGLYFDRETGDLVFTPTKCDEVGVIVIVITEWRRDSSNNWVIIGTTRRDMQIIVQNCSENNPPYFVGNNKYSVCEGSKLCFDIQTKDEPFLPKQTWLDTVTLTWNYGIPGATFTIVDPTAREKTGRFCWQTKVGDARSNAYTFAATAVDDNCRPRPASANRGYNVTVKTKARDKRVYEILECGKLRFNANIISDTINFKSRNYTFKYVIRDSTNSGVPLMLTYNKRDSFKFKRGGKYIIEHEINNPNLNCPSLYTDTVIIPPVLEVNLAFGQDTFICAGESLTIEPHIANGIPSYKFQWESPQGISNPKDSFPKYTLKPTADTKLILRLTDKNKCKDSDTILVHYQPNPVVDIGPDQRICTYMSVTLDAQNDDTMRYYWQPNGDSSRTITTSIAGRYIAKVIDHLGCNTSDTMILSVNDTVVAITTDREICLQDTLKVKAQRRPKGYSPVFAWRDLGSGVTVASDSAFSLKIPTMPQRKYELHLQVTQAGRMCQDWDTMILVVNALPSFNFKGLPPRCYADGAINLTTNVIATAFSGDKSETQKDLRYFQQYKKPSWITGGPVGVNTFVYDFPKFVTNAQVPKTGLKDTICYEYRDYKGCYNKECKATRLNPNPLVQTKNGIFCQKAGPITLDNLIVLPFSKTGGLQSFRILDVPPNAGVDPATILSTDYSVVPNTTLMDPGLEGENHKTGDYILEYCFKDAITGCGACDTSTVTVIRLPEIKFSGMPKQCINNPWLALDSFVTEANTGQRFPDGQWSAVEYGGSRDMSNSNVANKITNSVRQKKYFDPSLGAGQYLLKLVDVSSGCPVADSTEILVNGLPIIQIEVPDTVCSSSAPFALNNILPAGPVGTWSGKGVTGRDFDPSVSAKSKQYEGPVMLKFAFTNPLTGCSASDSQSLLIQSQPEIGISTTKPYQQCEGKTFSLNAQSKWAAALIWTTNGDGSFSNAALPATIYTHGLNDTALAGMGGNVALTASTVKEGVCPIAKDNINLIIEPYPQFSMLPHVVACEPARISFSSTVIKPAGSPNLRYSWDFGNGSSLSLSANAAPANIPYDSAKNGWYDLSLTVHNQWGAAAGQSCDTKADSADYVRILPQPKAGFSSSPGYFTTVAFPKFRFFNETKLRWGWDSMKYLWNFDQRDADDTSTQFNPVHSYSADTFTYWVNLSTSYRFIDEMTQEEFTCFDSTGQARKIGPDVTVFVPTAFSPEGTGPRTNNVFRPVVNGEKTFHIELFNRWGELLWISDDKFESWNGLYKGEKAQQDVYMWVVKVTAYDGEEYRYEGTVTLLR